MTRLSGWRVEDLAAAILEEEGYAVVQAWGRQRSRAHGGRVSTERRHDFLDGRFDLLAFGETLCVRVQVTRQANVSEKMAQADGETPVYCRDEVWQWASDGSGFARWWRTEQGWQSKDPVRVANPQKVLARADTSLG